MYFFKLKNIPTGKSISCPTMALERLDEGGFKTLFLASEQSPL